MDNEALRMQLEELTEAVRALSDKQNAQYTDLMLKLDGLYTDKERLDLVLLDKAQEIEKLYEEAKKIVIEMGKASTSLLQRKFNIGYERAAQLMNELEEEGIIGPADGAKPREVLVDELEEPEPVVEEPAEDKESLYQHVKKLALEEGEISTAVIQKKFDVGFARAATLIDLLEENGVIEKKDGVSLNRRVIAKDD